MTEIILFILGLSGGSFLNVLIDRLPKGQTIWGRSHCDWCKRQLTWYELIPVVSWITQGARCRRCHKPISIQYPLVELASGLGFVFLYMYSFQSPTILVSQYLLLSSLLVIFVADLKYQIIPDSMILIGVIGAIGGIWEMGAIWENVTAGAGAALFFFLLWRITRGRGMGIGDIKLAFLLGFLLGYPAIIVALYAAFLTGAIVGVILILGRRAGLKSKIAFGPFLIVGTLIALLWGERIITMWKGVL